MSEHTDSVLNGDFCEHCGEHLRTRGIEGFPQLCKACAKEICGLGGKVRKVGNGNWQDITPASPAAEAAAKKHPVVREMCTDKRPKQGHTHRRDGE